VAAQIEEGTQEEEVTEQQQEEETADTNAYISEIKKPVSLTYDEDREEGRETMRRNPQLMMLLV
jgi:hypothetical protein